MLDWFTTIPGILIICGVILLVIAIILFIIGAKKSKKEASVNTTQPVENNISEVVTEEPKVEVTETQPQPVVEEPVTPTSNIDTVVNVANINTENTAVEPNIIETPEINTIPTVEIPKVEDTTPVVNIPNVDSQVEEVTPTIEQPSTVYGGEVPKYDFNIQEEKPVTIYGGNDPLEATQTLPKVEENHIPYGGSYPEVKIVEPQVEQVVPTQVQETPIEIPTIEPITIPEINMETVEPTPVEVVETKVVEPITINEPEVSIPAIQEPVIIQPEVMPVVETVEEKKEVVEEL